MSFEIARHRVEIPVTEDNSVLDAYVAAPVGIGPCPGVIVGMELFGVDEHLREVTDRVARRGYVAIAPNFYHRSLPGRSLPFGDAGRAQGFEHLHKLRRPTVLNDVRAVLGWLDRQPFTSGRNGFLGFSMGGHIAYLAATQFDIAATAVFYGGWIVNTDIELSRPEPTVALTPGMARHGGRLIYFVGGRDHAVPADQREQLSQALWDAGVPHELIVYPEAGHGFFCDRRDTFDASARDDAWVRVQAFFAQALGSAQMLGPGDSRPVTSV